MKAPVQRTGVQSSGGTSGQCDGSYALDWGDSLASKPNALGSPFLTSDEVWFQSWFRDPPSPKTTSLSNGLTFTICPQDTRYGVGHACDLNPRPRAS